MAAHIRETILGEAPNGGLSVLLHISDKPKDAVDASFRLTLLATLPRSKRAPLLAQAQRRALEILRAELSGLLQDLQTQIDQSDNSRDVFDD